MIDKNHGETEASARRDRRYERAEYACKVFDKAARGLLVGGVEVLAVKFKMAGYPNGESMAIITADSDDGTPIVAFHTAVDFAELFVGLIARLENGSLKWKPDAFRIGKS